MNDVIKRLTIDDIYKIKLKYIEQMKELNEIDMQLGFTMKEINAHPPFRIDYRFENYKQNPSIIYFDKYAWYYLIKIYELEKYMLCTEYDKIYKQIIDTNNFPEFTPDNAIGWLDGLKHLIYENVKQMMQDVYDKLINKTYHTGVRETKKRNNSGVDKWFILTTYDYNYMYNNYREMPTITDDLEKLCYIIDGKKLPDITIKNKMKSDKSTEAENDYFKIKVCQNGNTHYKIKPDMLEKLNKLGSNKNSIGEKIKIKIFQ